MESRDKIIKYLDELLNITEFTDYCPKGLQVEGKLHVKKIVTGVSASRELFEKAHANSADMVIVHHGIFWDKDSRVIQGALKKRLISLLSKDITLLAYHLPLDAHQGIGNNGLAARALGIQTPTPFAEVGLYGQLVDPYESEALFKKVSEFYGSELLKFTYGPPEIRSIGICSGGCQGHLVDAINLNLDCFITGEAGEFVMHLAKESKIHFIAAGHYATECPGIKALGEHLAEEFEVEVEFIDIPNPV